MNLVYRLLILVGLLFCSIWLVSSFFQPLPLVAAINATGSQAIPARWDAQCVECYDGESYLYNNRVLRIDSVGIPHVAYGSKKLYHSWYDGSQWQQELIDVAEQRFEYVTFALDAADQPSISYYDTTDKSIKFAYQQTGRWITETVPMVLPEGYPQPLALTIDNANIPHILFSTYSYPGPIKLHHAWRGGNSFWEKEIIALEGLSIGSASLVFDSTGQMHVMYTINTNGNSGRGDYYLKYAWHDGTTWQTESVVRTGPWGYYHSLAVDATNRLHVSFMDGVAQTLQYGWRENGLWHFETVDTEGKTGVESSLVVDDVGQVHISYYEFEDVHFDYANIKLKYARYDGLNWIIETAVETGNFFGTSLALKGEQPHIVYLENSVAEFRLSLRNASGWETSLIHTGSGWTRTQSFALDSKDRPHLGYVQHLGVSCQLWYTFFNGVNWQYTLLSNWVYCDSISLKIDSIDRPHIVYVQNEVVEYVWFDGTDWQIEALFPGVADSDIALALDLADRPHILYFHETERIMHGWFDGITWQEEVIYDYPHGLAGDIVVGSDGRVHITFFEAGDEKYLLNYAWYDGTTWQIEAVNEPGEGGGDHDLVLDAMNQPYIVYIDTDHEHRLVYSWKSGSEWQSVPVLTNAAYPSLALDHEGQPHIIYITEVSPQKQQLRHVYAPEANWFDELISSNNAITPHIAIDSLGRPHAAWGGLDLLYSKRPLPLALHNTISPMTEVRADDIMTYTLTVSAPNLDVQLWSPLPEAVTYITGTLTAPAVYSPTAHAITWQGTLLADENMTFQFQATPTLTGIEQIPPLVNTAWLTEITTGEGIARTQIVNGKLQWLPVVNLPRD